MKIVIFGFLVNLISLYAGETGTEHGHIHITLWQLLAVIAILLVVFIIKNNLTEKSNIKLQKLVDERTSELQDINDNLEQIVYEKTKKLQDINSLLDESQEIAHMGSYHYDIIKDRLYWSKEHYRIFDMEPYVVLPTLNLFLTSVHPEDLEYVKERLEYIKTVDKTIKFEYKLITQKGNTKYVQSTAKVKYNKTNRQASIIGTLLDITVLKTLELEKLEKENLLAQQSKMAAMGEMLENIAHQWRQPLSMISVNASNIQVQNEFGTIDDSMIDKAMKDIDLSAQYLSKTIDDFRNFFNQSKEPMTFDLKDVVEKCLVLVDTKFDNNEIKVIKHIDDLSVRTLENELIQVLMNLFKNAVDALEQSEQDDKYIFVDIFSNDKSIFINVKDNGGGIPEDVIERIYEPYFTTKHKSQGTGIGLYMSFEIVSKHLNGSLDAQNEIFKYNNTEYKGALFTIKLPLK